MRSDSIAESANEMTPLKRKLDDFGAFLSKLIAAICIAVWVVSVGRFSDPVHGGFFRGAVHYFKTSVALAVAAIPEGLPAVVTTCLALGTRKMARRNAIVRSLPSVETLGCVSAICSDKTGTLTTNQVSVRNILTLSSSSQVGGGQVQSYSVTGSTFEPSGTVRDSYGRDINHPCDNRTLSTVAQCCCLCNDSELTYSSEKKQFDHIGESTEVALLVLAEKLSLPSDSPPQSSGHSASKAHNANASRKFWESRFHKQLTLDFTRDRKMMSTLCTTSHWAAARRFESDTNDKDEQASIVFTKGAAERVLERCTSALCDRTGKEMALNDAHRNALVDALSDKSEHGMRLLALAYKRYSTVREEISEKDECDMVFAGAVAMHDPPREEVSDAIQTCRAAGIRTIVVTGDNLITAESICKQIGALDSGESARECGRALTGSEFEKFDTDAQQRAAAQVALFARVEPQHKQELVAALKRRGEIVAMTGDGVNDAPALKKADIGVAMGSGTAVARYASDMVLADDNFLTIVSAVKEGRAIYNNTKQFIRYMVSSNIGEVVCIFIAALLQMPEPLIPVQLLWVNLVTDGLPATALGFNMPDSDVMKQKPRATQAPIVDRWLLIRYFAVGVYVGIATIAGFVWW
jgi:Ca2+-transporting ATPase/Ca2+ transporting ATPase